MRSMFALLVPSFVLIGFAYSTSGGGGGGGAVDTAEVIVNLQCSGNQIRQSVTPWELVIDQDDVVEWRLAPNAHSDTIEITPKQPGWPFVDSRPRGARNRPARSGNMRAAQSGRRYQYAITLVCDRAGGDTVMIDPDIVIR